MSKFGLLKEIFEIFIIHRRFYIFPIIVLLIALIRITALSQSGLITFIYPV